MKRDFQNQVFILKGKFDRLITKASLLWATKAINANSKVPRLNIWKTEEMGGEVFHPIFKDSWSLELSNRDIWFNRAYFAKQT
jgi:hypothetical protein